MNYERILKLAEKRSAASECLHNLGTMNVAVDPKQRITQDAIYQIAQDALDKANQEYRAAMDALTADELEQLMAEHNERSF